MRIGKFGQVNGLTIDTIRHYMDLGLIVPEKKGGQYFFDEVCQKDLEHILELKGMGFSLNEIKTISHYKNFGQLTPYEEDTYYQSLFLDKYENLEHEINNLMKAKKKLKLKLDELSAKTLESSSKMGIDLTLLGMLTCHHCNSLLTLKEGVINRNQIISGKLPCNCGEEYLIESGILMAGKQFKTKNRNRLENSISKYIHETDPLFLENLNKCLQWSKRKLEQMDLHQKVVMELGTGIGFFLRNVYQSLPEDCLYICVDHNLERHQFLKNLLERSHSKRKFLFICADFLEIPLPHHSVDLLIDGTGTSNYSFENEEFLLSQVDSLIKPEGSLLGTYLTFRNFSQKSKIASSYRDNFTLTHIKKKINGLRYKTLDEKISDSITRGGKYEDFFVEGEEVVSYSFFGKR
ncbi:MerR family transcriptional regulator [Neobacillus mesonae]|uniref:Methyltransferase n=1 Tax=Neobacillus mesonae TaxID=1193713 RepID=A0A3T0HWZ9_9BACI|nr:MerR family transcriptional regulator [Neobacillus mesonae]AZU61619.1 methyltransferase [Neobacillus mesonae]